jgi:hypothetical protein
MVLPGGIEPTTSPLPRECSTTELRQHRLIFAAHATGTCAAQPLRGNSLTMTQNPQDPNDPRVIARKKRQTAALKANMKKRKAAQTQSEEPPEDEKAEGES